MLPGKLIELTYQPKSIGLVLLENLCLGHFVFGRINMGLGLLGIFLVAEQEAQGEPLRGPGRTLGGLGVPLGGLWFQRTFPIYPNSRSTAQAAVMLFNGTNAR